MKRYDQALYNQAYLHAGDGPVVILLHGLFGNVAMWKPTVETLKSQYHVIIPRLPIFDLPVQQTNVKYLTNVLHDFIEINELTDVTIVGHAFGGQVALLYAAQYSSNVKRIVLTGSSGLFENFPFDESDPSGLDDRDFVQEKVESAFFEPGNAPIELVNEVYLRVTNIPNRLTLRTLSQSSQQNLGSLLNKLDHSVLLLWGLDDRITPPEVALHFHDYLPNSKIKFIEKCGHLPMVEQPAIFNQYLLNFLKSGPHHV